LPSTPGPQYFDQQTSFSNTPLDPNSEHLPTLSAPVGHRSILAEVRASQPNRAQKSSVTRGSQDPGRARSISQIPKIAGLAKDEDKGSTMSRGYVGGRSAQITTIQWLSSVKVGNKRDGSDGPHSGGDSGPASRYGSRSRPPSIRDPTFPLLDARGRNGKSGSRDREDDYREGDTNQMLKEE
jgi:WD repeat-containing protein 59